MHSHGCIFLEPILVLTGIFFSAIFAILGMLSCVRPSLAEVQGLLPRALPYMRT